MSGYKRWQSSIVVNALKTRRVVVVAGARQSGKTTLLKSLTMPSVEYRTLDDKQLLKAAKEDPQEFVKHASQLMIIDEVQKAVELLPAIKIAVDEDNRPGQFLLTGSANIQSLPSVTESLAGRIRLISLRPLSQGEILNHQPNFLQKCFASQFRELTVEKLSRDEIIEIALRGGYPEPLTFTPYDRQLWHQNYLDALFDRDLKEIIHIRRRDALDNLIQIVSAWSTKPMDIAGIGSSLSLQRNTVESYLNALQALYIIDRIPPYVKSDYEYAGKQPKLIMNDSGLMSSVLRLKLDNIRFDGDRVGKLIETHVGNELQKHVDHTEGRCRLYHFRDKRKREVDFLVEDDEGNLLGIEVKANTSADGSDFKHLKWFKETIAPSGKKFIGIVLYTGQQVSSFGDDMWAMPISCLY